MRSKVETYLKKMKAAKTTQERSAGLRGRQPRPRRPAPPSPAGALYILKASGNVGSKPRHSAAKSKRARMKNMA